MTSHGECNLVEVDVSADTETIVLDATIPSGRGGRIKQIRISGGCIATTAITVSAVVELKLGSHSGPYRFAALQGEADADLGIGGQSAADVIDVDIPVDANETVKGYITPTCALSGCHISITWETADHS